MSEEPHRKTPKETRTRTRKGDVPLFSGPTVVTPHRGPGFYGEEENIGKPCTRVFAGMKNLGTRDLDPGRLGTDVPLHRSSCHKYSPRNHRLRLRDPKDPPETFVPDTPAPVVRPRVHVRKTSPEYLGGLAS